MLLIGAGVAMCLFGGWLWVTRWSKVRHLLDTPTSRIRSAAQGYVELAGVLREWDDAPPLFAPLTGKACLWWRYRIEEYRAGGNRSTWRIIEQGTSDGLLRLSDSTGECLVDPRGAEVLPARYDRWTGDLRHPRGVPHRGALAWLTGHRKYRYVEERLHADEPLYAIGDFRTNGGGRQGLDVHVAQREVVREWKEDYAGLLQRFDNNRDGQLDQAEWSRVRLAASLEAQNRHRLAGTEAAEHRLMRPGEGLPFVLSSHGEEVLARRYRWHAAGGAVLCLVGATVLAAQMVG
ncbi:E3 ubiquitin ligase family protein [Stutzerimonas stutzeri]|uniref:E3 ubiquitin ligase family protein n=1 Tax=Stutzerimonas stutzeri TaxID=316 RepID=UPI00210C391B|nr:E3 ubiquitin ligase family protein [Stutzerimonas stutzeri]MCQ4260623.1 E3 ubiquitin ligase family protein [Stutzerimonas stutzeri]